MADYVDVKNNHSAGELSPLLAARGDLAAYQHGVAILQNMLPLPQGGVMNRPGLSQAAVLGANFYKAFPFVVNNFLNWVCVVGSDGSAVMVDYDGTKNTMYGVTGTNPYGIDVLGLSSLQSVDYLYLFHAKYPPARIARTGATTFTYEEIDRTMFAMSEANLGQSNFAYSVNYIGLQDSMPYFQLMMYNVGSPKGASVGESFMLECEYPAQSTNNTFSFGAGGGEDTEEPVMLYGSCTIETGGSEEGPNSWHGTLELLRYDYAEGDDLSSIPDSSFYTFSKWVNVADDDTEEEKTYGANIGLSFTVDEPGSFFKFKYSSGFQSKLIVKKQCHNSRLRQYFTILSTNQYDYPQQILAQGFAWPWGVGENSLGLKLSVDGYIFRNAAFSIAEWSDAMGWPAVGSFYQERLVLANTTTKPTTLWFSQPNDWLNFRTSITPLDTDSVIATLSSKQVNEIVSLVPRSDLLVFTSGGEFILNAGGQSDVITPSNISILPASYIGSALYQNAGTIPSNVPPLDIGSNIFYVQRGGSVIRSLGYKLEVDGYDSSDITIMAEHLFRGKKIVSWAYQQTPWSIIWIVLEGGSVVSLTVQQEHQVMAFARHSFYGGAFKAWEVVVTPSQAQDEVYFLGDVNGAQAIYRMSQRDDTKTSAVFEDYLGAGSTRYPIQCIYETFELENMQGAGSLTGKYKHISGVTFRLYNSYGFWAGIINEREDITKLDVSPETDELMNVTSGKLFTGDIYMKVPGGVSKRSRLRVTFSDVAPLTILGIYQEVSFPSASPMQTGDGGQPSETGDGSA